MKLSLFSFKRREDTLSIGKRKPGMSTALVNEFLRDPLLQWDFAPASPSVKIDTPAHFDQLYLAWLLHQNIVELGLTNLIELSPLNGLSVRLVLPRDALLKEEWVDRADIPHIASFLVLLGGKDGKGGVELHSPPFYIQPAARKVASLSKSAELAERIRLFKKTGYWLESNDLPLRHHFPSPRASKEYKLQPEIDAWDKQHGPFLPLQIFTTSLHVFPDTFRLEFPLPVDWQVSAFPGLPAVSVGQAFQDRKVCIHLQMDEIESGFLDNKDPRGARKGALARIQATLTKALQLFNFHASFATPEQLVCGEYDLTIVCVNQRHLEMGTGKREWCSGLTADNYRPLTIWENKPIVLLRFGSQTHAVLPSEINAAKEVLFAMKRPLPVLALLLPLQESAVQLTEWKPLACLLEAFPQADWHAATAGVSLGTGKTTGIPFLSEDVWSARAVLGEEPPNAEGDGLLVAKRYDRGFFQEPSSSRQKVGIWSHLPNWTVSFSNAALRLVRAHTLGQTTKHSPVITVGLVLDDREKGGETGTRMLVERWAKEKLTHVRLAFAWAKTYTSALTEAKDSPVDWIFRVHRCIDKEKGEKESREPFASFVSGLSADKLSVEWNAAPTILFLEHLSNSEGLTAFLARDDKQMEAMTFWDRTGGVAGRGKFPAMIAPFSRQGIMTSVQMMAMVPNTRELLRAVQDACLALHE